MTAHTRHDPVAPVDPAALSPVLRVLRACMHALVAVLVVVLVVRATAAPDGVGRHGSSIAGPVAVSLGALAFSVVYATGAWWPRVRHSVRAAGAWLSVLLVCWVVLVLLTPDAVWLAFPLFFLELHLLRRWGLLAVLGTLVVTVAGFGWHQHALGFGTVLGPAIGAAVVVATVRGYEALARESEQRSRLIAELTATRADLAAAEHDAGVLAERERLAREIHDTLAQGLSSIQLLLRAAERTLDTDLERARHQVSTAREAAAANLAEARRFVRDWAPPDLESGSLEQALESLCARTTEDGPLGAHVTVSGTPVALPSAHEVALWRIAQQAVANAVQHARASHVELTLSFMDTEVALDVVDDGRGFAVPVDDAPPGTFGLATMRSRARSLGGTLVVESEPGAGTAVAVTLPLVGGPDA